MTISPSTPGPETAEPARLVRELSRPEAYPAGLSEVGFLQTHISLLFFAGERVYKVKKPVDLGFLDFTTLERRRHFCEEEVRLNRRLAPHVYLGVVPITAGPDGHLLVGGTGTPVEWAVEMVRLPEARMFAELLERGEIDNERMNALAALLADFHAGSATGDEVDEHGSPAAVRANALENFTQLADFAGEPDDAAAPAVRVLTPRQLAFLRTRGLAFLDAHDELLRRRVREGRIREGHGDLHAGNLCLTRDGVVAYDCIEFNRRFRCGDVAADLAFLTMDLDFRGYPGFSGYLAKRYAEVADDRELAAVERYYKGYRAIVRGKVAAFTAADPGLDAERREERRLEAMRYLQLATAYELPPVMILMCGLPACGKSWLARRLAASFRAAVVTSDVRRKMLAGLPPTQRVRPGYGAGLYAPEMKEKTYRSLLASALAGLRSGHSVIVDATFAERATRRTFVDAATRLDLAYYVVHVSASDALSRERLALRAADPRAVSDADLDVYLRARETFEPPTEVPRAHLLESESGAGAPEEQSSVVLDRMIALRGS